MEFGVVATQANGCALERSLGQYSVIFQIF